MEGDFFITQWAFLGMRWLYESLTNESIVLTILIATIIIRLLSVFGDIKSRKSTVKMQAVQPQLDKIRKKYENNPEKLNLEQRKFMKENNVSMFGGCLPMLITMPLFFIFIAAFRQWGNEMMVKLILTMEENEQAGLEMFEKFKFLWVNNMWQPDNGMMPVVQAAKDFFGKANAELPKLLYFKENPAALQKFIDLGFFVQNGDKISLASITAELTAKYDLLMAPCVNLYAGKSNGWFIFPLLAGASMFLSSWIMTKNQPKNDAAGSTGKLMQWMFPLMSVWFCMTYNTSFALYWTFSSLLSIVTTVIINKSIEKDQQAIVEVSKK
ncbi:MAG: YidC/Oxa1 family membrane protein insertase [Clostridia bacterium]